MAGMYGGGSNNAAAQARADEVARRNAINKGVSQIDAVFSGTRGTKKAANYLPGQKYYDEFGAEFNPQLGDLRDLYNKTYGGTTLTGGVARNGEVRPTGAAGVGAPAYDAFVADQTAKAYKDAISRGKLFTGTETSGGFDDKFYDQRRQAFEDYALPQLADQYRTQQGQITSGLARRGLLNSGAAIRAKASLDKYTSSKKREIGDQALNQENQLREQVANERSNLVNQVVASGDPTLAASGALSAAAGLKRPTGFQPLGNLFADFTSTLAANQQARAYDPNVAPLWNFGGRRNGSMTIV